MYPTAHKEQFSLAYIRAVAAASGFDVYEKKVDDDSVDICISAGIQGSVSDPKLEIQAKCVTAIPYGDQIAFDLKLKNYDDLRRVRLQIPRILVILTIPKEVENWTSHSEDGFTLKRCAYWVSLLGSPETTNRWSVTVRAPRQQVFSPAALQKLMILIARGGKP